jgi:mRNA-degrading endonuclease RelE of RelBE toxin-antitoxin system
MCPESVTISFTLEFKRNMRVLAKKYRSIRSDIQPLIDRLQSGDFPGDQVPGVNLTIFKVRLQNSDIQKGKRSGYRCIYYLKTDSNIILVTIYSKTEQADITSVRIRSILHEMG